jgi:hypothetical protein
MNIVTMSFKLMFESWRDFTKSFYAMINLYQALGQRNQAFSRYHPVKDLDQVTFFQDADRTWRYTIFTDGELDAKTLGQNFRGDTCGIIRKGTWAILAYKSEGRWVLSRIWATNAVQDFMPLELALDWVSSGWSNALDRFEPFLLGKTQSHHCGQFFAFAVKDYLPMLGPTETLSFHETAERGA